MKRIFVIAALVIAASLLASGQLKNKMTDQKARESLAQWLAGHGVSQGGLIISIAEAPISRAFPSHFFYALSFRRYPVAQALPEPLTYNNLFVAQPDGKVELLSDTNALEAFFRAALAPVKNEDQAKDAVRAWLRLGEEFHQDGLFEFTIPEDTLALAREGGVIKVSGKAKVIPDGGNKGEITASLIFNQNGGLVSASETGDVVAGPRPSNE